MNCPKCGVELLEHVSFCPLCGSALPDDLWQKKKSRTQTPRRKPRKPVKKAKPKTVTMRPTEPEPEGPKTVTMKPVEERPKTVTMRPTEPTPPAPAPPEAAPGRTQVEEPAPPATEVAEEPVPAPPAEEPAPPEPTGDKPPSGETVDMLCPMCDSIVSIPVERPIHVKCPKCSEEYYFAK